MVSYFSQLIPEAYLTTPLLLPFPPKSHSVLRANAIHGFTKDERLISHILPKECCWFARTGHAIARIPDGFVTCAALVDYSDQREWIRQKATMPHSPEFPMLLDNHDIDCKSIINDRVRRNSAINADETRDDDTRRECKIVNMKIKQEIEDKNLFVGSSTHESKKKLKRKN